MLQNTLPTQPSVVILGGGFGGLAAAESLNNSATDVTLIDRRNHHLFQPLLYQVATAGLSPADISVPIRGALSGQKNAQVLMSEVKAIKTAEKKVVLEGREIPYDYLVVATGAQSSYFGHPEWEKHAPSLKTVEDATAIRRKILTAFETAEMTTDETLRKELLNFTIIGGGPTGVELAGAVAELSSRVLMKDFRHITPEMVTINLIEAGPRILGPMDESLSKAAHQALEKRGVKILTNVRVRDIQEDHVDLGDLGKLATRSVIWGAGVMATPVGSWLGVTTDRGGRVSVDEFCRVPGLENVFVIGDAALHIENGKPLPGLAPVAKQQGEYVGKLIRDEIAGKTQAEPFHYTNRGVLATVGRSYAVAEIGKFKNAGLATWLSWWLIHILYLSGFKNKASVFMNWAWSYLTYGKGARLITNDKH